ncbi:MAG: SUMF1/EgtB/PvdO family nonheme iron enzyme [Thermodesulfobacteriota bacterium]
MREPQRELMVMFAPRAGRGVVLFLVLCSVFLAGDSWKAQAQPRDQGKGEKTVSAEQQQQADKGAPSPSRLFESIQGYLRGGHQSDAPEKKRTPRTDRYRPVNPKTQEDESAEYRRIVEREADLARSRMQRKEWALAAQALERALAAASHLKPEARPSDLQSMLAEVRTKVSAGPGVEPAAGRETTNSIGMKLVLIKPGTFRMGNSSAEVRRVESEWNVQREILEAEEPERSVRISSPFYIGKYEVTVGQFKRFVDETGYRTIAEKQGSGWVYDREKKHWVQKAGASWRNPGVEIWEDHPVTLIGHEDAEAFCKWLSAKERIQYQLPTEAQWEYAARGGKEGERFFWGNDYPDGTQLNSADRRSPVPWADRTIDDGYAQYAPVGSFEPNGFWLYDMAGNVWELCQDFYAAKPTEKDTSGAIVDPIGPRTGSMKVVRGGCWAFGAGTARNAFRFGVQPNLAVDMSGFRVVAAPSRVDPTLREASSKPAAGDAASVDSYDDLVSRIKALVTSGRRAEARRLADEYLNSPGAGITLDRQPQAVLRQALDSLIDVSKDQRMVSFTNSLGMKMVRIPTGSFVMGSSEADIAWAITTLAQGAPVALENEYPFHKVRISRPFFFSAHEVTVAQFRAFVEETGYVTDAEADGGGQVFNADRNRFEVKEGSSWRDPGWKIEDPQPVVMVSYYDAQAYVDWLTAKEKLPYKLPTEAQWEYACRGGLPMAQFAWGDSLPDGRKANYADKNTDFQWRDRYADDGHKYVAPVGTYEPNGFGLYDMAGNALEWVSDYYGDDYYRYTPEVDPEGPGTGEHRVMKGGEWTFGAVNLRCAFRGWSRPELALYNTGFRVAIDLGSARRPFHFASDFLTKEWVPGPDQREVAQAVAREQDRMGAAAAARATETAPPPSQLPAEPPVRGVMVIGFTPKSDAKKVGLAVGDVIIEYDGVRDLTAEKFLALTARTNKGRKKPMLILVRNGYEYSAHVEAGFLGVTVTSTKLRGPFKQPGQDKDQKKRDQKPDKTKAKDWT